MKTRALLFLFFWLFLWNLPKQSLGKSLGNIDEIALVWESFIKSWEKMDAGGCASVYWEDALNIPPDLPENKGRAAIEEFYKELFEAHRSSQYQHRTDFIAHENGMLIEYGEFSVQWLTKDGRSWQYTARTLVYWKKDDSGNWKIKTLIFNQGP